MFLLSGETKCRLLELYLHLLLRWELVGSCNRRDTKAPCAATVDAITNQLQCSIETLREQGGFRSR